MSSVGNMPRGGGETGPGALGRAWTAASGATGEACGRGVDGAASARLGLGCGGGRVWREPGSGRRVGLARIHIPLGDVLRARGGRQAQRTRLWRKVWICGRVGSFLASILPDKGMDASRRNHIGKKQPVSGVR